MLSQRLTAEEATRGDEDSGLTWITDVFSWQIHTFSDSLERGLLPTR